RRTGRAAPGTQCSRTVPPRSRRPARCDVCVVPPPPSGLRPGSTVVWPGGAWPFAGASTCPIECGDTGHAYDIDSARPGVLAWRSALQGEIDPHLHRPGAHCSADAQPVAELLHLPAGQLTAEVVRLVQVDPGEPVGGDLGGELDVRVAVGGEHLDEPAGLACPPGLERFGGEVAGEGRVSLEDRGLGLQHLEITNRPR